MDGSIAQHCRELNRCNQRGGRMLSILDLLDAGTLDLDLAAFLMARIARGASFMVGARPGGAGKTTVMCALLNLVPRDVALVAATAETVRAAGNSPPASPPRCYVCHEIGAGPYFAYLWGRDLRAYCALSEQGHLLATNLHADDLDETHAQVCVENGVLEGHFNAFDLLVYVRVSGGWRSSRRWIEKVYASDGVSRHQLVFDTKKGLNINAVPGRSDPAQVKHCRAFLARLAQTNLRSIEAVRKEVVEFLASGS